MGREDSLMMYLAKNKDYLHKLLESLPISISDSTQSTVRFDVYGHHNKAYSLNLNTLKYYNFRDNKGGNLIDLLSEFNKKSREEIYTDIYTNMLFNGCIQSTNCDDNFSFEEEYQLKYPEPYDECELNRFKPIISSLFKKDNIWVTTQIKWDIRYDYDSNRIIIPVYQDMELVGAIGRLNKSKLEEYENKYLPLLRYNKSTVLFGLDMMRDKIKETKSVILVESEKSVLKAWQYNYKTPVLAVGSSSVSRHQIERLNILGVSNILLALDKGIENKDVVYKNLLKLKQYSTAKNIYNLEVDDVEQSLLDDKECVFDRTDLKEIEYIIKNYTRKIED